MNNKSNQMNVKMIYLNRNNRYKWNKNYKMIYLNKNNRYSLKKNYQMKKIKIFYFKMKIIIIGYNLNEFDYIIQLIIIINKKFSLYIFNTLIIIKQRRPLL